MAVHTTTYAFDTDAEGFITKSYADNSEVTSPYNATDGVIFHQMHDSEDTFSISFIKAFSLADLGLANGETILNIDSSVDIRLVTNDEEGTWVFGGATISLSKDFSSSVSEEIIDNGNTPLANSGWVTRTGSKDYSVDLNPTWLTAPQNLFFGVRWNVTGPKISPDPWSYTADMDNLIIDITTDGGGGGPVTRRRLIIN